MNIYYYGYSRLVYGTSACAAKEMLALFSPSPVKNCMSMRNSDDLAGAGTRKASVRRGLIDGRVHFLH